MSRYIRHLLAPHLVVVLLIAMLSPLASAGCGKTIGATIDDATITTRVKTALLNDPVVGGLRIDVDTANGVVTLSGRVKSPDEQARAIELARQIGGVKDVRATLQVEP